MRRARLALLWSLLLPACGVPPAWTGLSPDRSTMLTVVARGPWACVSIGDRPDACYDGVSIDGVVFSERGQHVAYSAQAGTRWTVVRDGVPGAMWDGVGTPVLSSDGARLAYPALDGEHWRVVVDSDAGPPFDAIISGTLGFGVDGRTFGYLGQRAESVYAVVDGAIGEGWNEATRLTLGANGRSAYVARRGPLTTFVLNGERGPWHDAIGDFAVADDGAPWAYAARQQMSWYVIDRYSRWGPFDSARAVAFVPETGALSFVAHTNGSEIVFLDGVEVRRHDSVDSPVFSRSGAHWGYVAQHQGRALVFIDGALLAEEDNASDLVLSGDGRRFSYLARRGTTTEIVDERGRYRFDFVIDGTLQFLSDGRWTCLAGDRTRRQLRVIVDGAASSRVVHWSELVTLARRGQERGLRALVAAEAKLAYVKMRQR
jgi:hypothetical protein